VKTAYDLANGKVSSVTAANSTITVAGTATAPTVALGTTGPGAGALGTTTAQTPQLTLDAYGRVTAFTNATINDTTKLPLAGGTMTAGSINMNSVSRITNLQKPVGANEPPRAGDLAPSTPSTLHGLKAWTYDPAIATGATLILSANTLYLSAIYVPYTMTVTQIWAYVNTAGVNGSSGTSLYLGIYDSGTLLGSTVNQNTTLGLTGALGYTMSSSVTLGPGQYWIGIKFVTGTGGTAPTLQKTSSSTAAIINFNIAASPSLATQRASQAPGLSGALPSDLTALSNIIAGQGLFLHGLS
jgi:hypothetical protein